LAMESLLHDKLKSSSSFLLYPTFFAIHMYATLNASTSDSPFCVDM